MRPSSRGRAGGWRALGRFWGAVVLLVLGVAGGLAWLGPPPPPLAGPTGAGGASADAAPTGGRADALSQGRSAGAEERLRGAADRLREGPFLPAPDGAPTVPAADSDRVVAGLRAPPAAGDALPSRHEDAGATRADRAAAGARPPPAPEPPPLASIAVSAPVARPEGARPIPPPDPALLEERADGIRLPRIGPGGRTSLRAYAHAGFDRSDTRPRVAVVLAGIGLSASDTEEAIRRLPPAVTLALDPYAPRLEQVAERARERGMEMLIAVPTESPGYPLAEPADRALRPGLSLAENLDRLDWVLARSAGYVGVLGGPGPLRGERSAQFAEFLGSVQDVLCARGLLYVDPRPGAPNPPRAWGRAVDVVLDEPATRGEIERRLAELERLARARGSALGLAGSPAPVAVERLAAWAAGLDARGVALAPLTAVIHRPTSARCAGDVPAAEVAPASAAPARR